MPSWVYFNSPTDSPKSDLLGWICNQQSWCMNVDRRIHCNIQNNTLYPFFDLFRPGWHSKTTTQKGIIIVIPSIFILMISKNLCFAGVPVIKGNIIYDIFRFENCRFKNIFAICTIGIICFPTSKEIIIITRIGDNKNLQWSMVS